MKQGFLDDVSDKVYGFMEHIDTALEKYTGDLPFGKREMTQEEKMQTYKSLKPQDIMSMVQQFGEEPVGKWLMKMNKLSRRE